MAEPKILIPDADLLAEHRAGESQRALADRYGVALGTISRRITRAKRAEAEARKASDRDKAKRRQRLAAANRAGQRIETQVPLDSTEEARRLAARYPLSDPLPVETAPEEIDGRAGRQFEQPEGSIAVLWDYPRPGLHALALDLDALAAICGSEDRAHWFANEAMTAHGGSWLIPGEPDPSYRYGFRTQRLVRFPDRGRYRAFIFRGHQEPGQVARTFRGLVYDQRYSDWPGWKVPDDGKARVRFIAL